MSENNNNIGYVNVTSTEIKCPGCGTSIGIHFNPATGTLNCPFCGSTSVTPAAENDRIMAPTAIIPFAFSKEQAQDYFIKFVKKKTLLNKKALNCKLENIVGIYLPFWTFDTFTASTYNARRYNGQEAHSDHVTGDWYEIIDDVLVCRTE